jgi:hypothetical protein
VGTLAELLVEIGVDAKEVAEGTKNVEGHFKKSFAGLAVLGGVFGGIIGGQLMQGIDSIIESSKPIALLSAQLGAGTPVAAAAGKAAGEVYANGVVDSMEDATAAVKSAVQQALVPPNASSSQIAEVANQISNLSTVMEEDAGNVSKAVGQMIKTGLVDNAQEGFDLLQKGVEQGVNKADDLLDTFNEYGTQFRNLGLDGQTAMGLISQGLKGGARDADQVADAIKEFSIRAVDGSTTTAQGFKDLGLNAKDMQANIAKGGDSAAEAFSDTLEALDKIKDPAKRSQAAVKLFGTQAEDLGGALYKLNMGDAADQMGNFAGASKKAGDALQESAGARLEKFKRSLQNDLTNQLAKLIPYIDKTFGWLKANSDWVQPLAIALGILAGAIGIVVLAQGAWNAVMALSPVVWIAAAIIGLIALIVYLATKTQFFQTIWGAVWGFLKGVASWFAGPFTNFFKAGFNAVIGAAVAVWHALVAAFTSVKNFFAGIGGWFAGPFAGFFVRAYHGVMNTFTSLKNGAVNIFNTVLNKAKSFVSWYIGIPGRLAGALRGMFSPLWAGFKSNINRVIGAWNSLHFTIPSFSVLGHSFGGGSIGVPNIPYMAKGGVVSTPTLAMIGEAGPEAVVPLNRAPEFGGRDERPIVVQVVPGGEPEFRRWVKKTIRVKGSLGNGTATA